MIKANNVMFWSTFFGWLALMAYQGEYGVIVASIVVAVLFQVITGRMHDPD